MNFDGFFGNERAKEALNRLTAGRLPQAIVLHGDRGCGKRTLARRLAQACVCTGAQRPCGVCAACRKFLTGGHPDILWIDGGDRPRAFGVDQIRAVRDTLYIQPNEADCKVYVLTQAQNMTDQAQNALLKMLEEPPAYAVFLLTAESLQQLLPTVRSRVVAVPLFGVSEAEAVSCCGARVPDAAPDTLHALARLWNGNIGQMLESLSDGALKKAQEICAGVPEALIAPAETALLRLTAPMTDRALCRTVCTMLRAQFRDAAQFETVLTPVQALRCADCVGETLRALDRYANPNLTVTRLCAALRRAVGK